MTDILKELLDKKLLREIDVYFAINICASFKISGSELLFALLYNATERGDTCLTISRPELITFYKLYKNDIDKAFSEIPALVDKKVIAEAPATDAPFILKNEKLYLKSFYTDESKVSNYIESQNYKNNIDSRLTILLNKYFKENSMQKAAALNAALNSFSVISGGPGTGKTSTVFRLLAIMLELSEEPLRIAICAPTGKAASRLTESIISNREIYKSEPYIDCIPEKAVTIHRLLGMFSDIREPKYHKDNKLPYDILIADEASMIDLKTMAKLTDAIKKDCKLVILGDKDQLASVQPGAVLGDICEAAPVNEFSEKRLKLLSKHTYNKLTSSTSKYSDITIMLDKSYRYDSEAGIGLLANASIGGDVSTAMRVLLNDKSEKVDFVEFDSNFEKLISDTVTNHSESYYNLPKPEDAIEAFNKLRILSPHKSMSGGTEHINTIASRAMFKAGHSDNTDRFYHGMPLMITENDYSLNLFNGETGLVFKDNDLKACFNIDNGEVRRVTPARLPAYVPAYSMTVHKSQGSEFDHVIFVLPESDSGILTRELFYTAVTRAKNRLTVISTEKAVRNCLSNKIHRTSGLLSS